MIRDLLSKSNRFLFFIVSSSIACGIVFFGILIGFGFMLGEQGVPASTITTLFLATSPYSFKFAISPFVKNTILKFQKYGMKTIKVMAYMSEIIIMVGVSLFGIYSKDSSYLLIFSHILLVVLAGSIHDLLGDYIRLTHFQGKLLGTATSIGTIGFRVGMFLAGAGLLYLASSIGWKHAYIYVSLFILLSFCATFLLQDESITVPENKSSVNSLKSYFHFCCKLFKEYNIIAILLLTLSFKFSDSCINGLKTVFMQLKGFSKVDFANVSQIIGIFVIITAGTIAASLTYKYELKKCMKFIFLLNLIPSICFVYLSSSNNCSFIGTAILLSFTTFFFGVTAVIYRVYISKISKSDINTYTILLSIGSALRSLSLYLGGYLVDFFSWKILYIVCLLSNLPGILICFFGLSSTHSSR